MFPIRILLVDDHVLFARSLQIALEESGIGSLRTTQQVDRLDELLAAEPADVVLLDINLGKTCDIDGLQLARRLLGGHPGLKIVMLTGYDLPIYRHEARRIGVSGFLCKSVSPDELVLALRRVEQGKTCFPPETERIVEELTDTERQILRLLGAGKKRRAVAGELLMSERTLSNHLQHIYEKLGVSSAVEAIARAIRMGYISVG